MVGLGDRIKYFGYEFRTEGEGAAWSSKPEAAPEIWMRGDTHFRPWFNVGNDVREIGYGIAKGADDKWYFCVISGLGVK